MRINIMVSRYAWIAALTMIFCGLCMELAQGNKQEALFL